MLTYPKSNFFFLIIFGQYIKNGSAKKQCIFFISREFGFGENRLRGEHRWGVLLLHRLNLSSQRTSQGLTRGGCEVCMFI